VHTQFALNGFRLFPPRLCPTGSHLQCFKTLLFSRVTGVPPQFGHNAVDTRLVRWWVHTRARVFVVWRKWHGTGYSRVDYCCDCFSVVDSFLTVTLAGESGLEESVLTSTLRELLLDSVTGAGAAAAGAGAATGAAAAVGGACWQPMSVRPKAARAETAKSLQKFGFIKCGSLFSLQLNQASVWPFEPNP
jgi:hypothetical protein